MQRFVPEYRKEFLMSLVLKSGFTFDYDNLYGEG
ncbi:hypothetical protein HMPREF1148_1600, partial [Selenomonas sp. FOBRC6]